MTPSIATRLFRGEARIEAFGADHRGVAYGDGLFETMRVHEGRVDWWDRHWARLSRGAARLRLRLPDPGVAMAEAAALCEGRSAGVLKLIVSRGAGEGGRGYAPAPAAAPEWQLSAHPLPATPRAAGLRLRWCATRLSRQPLLAGIKHCNRLEQVLARAEWDEADDRDADEGLLLDDDGHVVSAVAANVFALRDGRWRTPKVDRCGVAGVCRGWAIDALDAERTRLRPEDVATADAVFLCNAVRGILPVARLGGRTWPPHPRIAQAQRLLSAAHPAFAPEPP